MKSDSFTFDSRLYQLLQQDRFAKFTTRDLRDAYAQCLGSVRRCFGGAPEVCRELANRDWQRLF